MRTGHAHAQEDSRAAPTRRAVPRTFESLHDTQAVFLLIRDCGEDCSAAEARRSSDSRDSPLDIVGEGFGQSTLLGVPCCRGEGDVAEALPTMFAGSALRADGVGRGCLSQSQTTRMASPGRYVTSEIGSGSTSPSHHRRQWGSQIVYYKCV